MKILFIGTVEFSKNVLKKLIGLKADIVGVITKQKSTFNADFFDLTPFCQEAGILCKYISDINLPENIEWVKSLKPDIIFCFGWSSLLKEDILNAAPMGVIGFHPAYLPQNRGRHPIIWALALGLDKTASTFFFMDEGADSGDILSQKEINITYEDNAKTLYEKITNTALSQIEDFLPKLQNHTFQRIKQNHSLSNIWRKRGKNDGKIDFRMSSKGIYNLVRALTKPYIGAHIEYKEKEVKIWEVKEIKINMPNIEPGKILNIKNNEILVKCYDNAVLLVQHEFHDLPLVGEYL